VDVEESLDLQQARDAVILRVAVAREEEPAVDGLALGAAGPDHLGDARAGVPPPVAHQP